MKMSDGTLTAWMQSFAYASNFKYGDQLGVLLLKDAQAAQLHIALGASTIFYLFKIWQLSQSKNIHCKWCITYCGHMAIYHPIHVRVGKQKLQNGSNYDYSATESATPSDRQYFKVWYRYNRNHFGVVYSSYELSESNNREI